MSGAQRPEILIAALAFGTLALASSPARAEVEFSTRAGLWSGTRLNQPDEGLFARAEIWMRSTTALNSVLEVRTEGWVSTDPAGDNDAGIEVRQALVAAKLGGLRLEAGRDVYAWGRTDRINPTDVVGPRDHRRLVDDENDNRRGIATVRALVDVAGGELSLHWLPEFRATELPTVAVPGVEDVHPDSPEQQFAVRYERFGAAFDWSVSYAQVADRTPWVSVAMQGGRPVTSLRHPTLRMFGGDFATTLGPYGVRGEAAIYDYDDDDLTGVARRRPAIAVVLGADRDFPGQLNVNVQGVVRMSKSLPETPPALAPVALRNGTVQIAWRDTLTGGTVRVRKAFAADRASVEASAAAYEGGGRFAQMRASYAIRDGVRLTALAERFEGNAATLFGGLKNNNVISLGVRVGF
ncbi:hypothetical protein [Caulobacter sp. NIBR2454]|uniref:hypothetical protein n=1 Tax=Caulobacter sp. NIBR2454 TaxID=3015996 RepID=UPI0022B61FB9|nr:hypothetical protein [Caulobacter sp. NIBR2454]